METLRVQVNFSGQRDADLGTIGQTIVNHMTDNQSFRNLAADVALLQAAHIAYMQALGAAPKAGALARAIKDDRRRELEIALHDLGVKINLMAKGNVAL